MMLDDPSAARFRRTIERAQHARRTRSTDDRMTLYIATTDYVNETPEGYINPHLHRVPVTLSKGRQT